MKSNIKPSLGGVGWLAAGPVMGKHIRFDKANDGGGGDEPLDAKAVAAELRKIGDEVKKSQEEVRKVANTAMTEVNNLGKLTEDTKKSFDDGFTKLNGLTARVSDLEQKMVRAGTMQEPVQAKSIGELFVESDSFKAAKLTSSSKGHASVRINRKNITSATSTVGSNTSGGTSLIPADMQPGIVMPPNRQLVVRSLLAPGTTSSNLVEYAQEVGFTNNAAVVSEGSTKPKSDITFELRSAPVRTIAHIFKASRQILDDVPALRSYIDARATYGLRFAEESELLTGDGTGQHLSGLVTLATPYSAAFVATSPQQIDTVRLAMLQVMLAQFPPSGIVLNPTDWAKIQLTKDGMDRYIIGNPQDGNTPRLWNLPVVESLSMSVDTFLVGAFSLAAQIFDRLDLEILLSTENSDDFERNMVTIRAEERLALAVYRPEAIVYGDFGLVT